MVQMVRTPIQRPLTSSVELELEMKSKKAIGCNHIAVQSMHSSHTLAVKRQNGNMTEQIPRVGDV